MLEPNHLKSIMLVGRSAVHTCFSEGCDRSLQQGDRHHRKPDCHRTQSQPPRFLRTADCGIACPWYHDVSASFRTLRNFSRFFFFSAFLTTQPFAFGRITPPSCCQRWLSMLCFHFVNGSTVSSQADRFFTCAASQLQRPSAHQRQALGPRFRDPSE